MSERTDGDRIHPAEPQQALRKTTGQEIDDLVRSIPRSEKATGEARGRLARAERDERAERDRLVELVGRPTAARMLGLTPRELAGKLRGEK